MRSADLALNRKLQRFQQKVSIPEDGGGGGGAKGEALITGGL